MSGFLDEVVVTFESGSGGDGAASFHREKHVPRGGPNGADGGRGGDVILVADRGKRTLYDFKLQDHYRAGSGSNAHLNKRGRDGETIIVHVPVGTIVTDLELDEVVVDLSVDGMKTTLCRGGRGGMGNLHFTNSVRQAPTFAQKGAPGESLRAKLELKLLADVGLVGLPNAGKSTLLSQLSAAKPKIGAYPFTTITPNLGVATVDGESFCIADLPGLIEGASEGHGLGHQFLKHAERTRILVHVVDSYPMDGTSPRENYDLVEKELAKYDEAMAGRSRVVVLNKADLLTPEARSEVTGAFADLGLPCFMTSGATGEGLESLMYHLITELRNREAADPVVPTLKPVFRDRAEDEWSVETEDGAFVVRGKRIERLVAMTDLSNRDALHHLHRKLARIGVIERLREAGAEDGDSVVIGEFEFDFQDW